MTLIVGVKCNDGVVLGADGAATYGSLGTHTIRQRIKKKLKIIGSSIVIGTSGPIGLGQRFVGLVETLRINGLLYKNMQAANQPTWRSDQVMQVLREQLWKLIELEIQIARSASQVLAANLTITDALSTTIIAMDVDFKPCLFSFDQQASPEEASEDLPFVAIGSGQLIADPFLAFIRRLYWPDRLPTLQEGRHAVYWTLHHAIETNPGGVAAPIQVVVLAKEGAQWKARELPPEEGEEHLEIVKRVEARIPTLDKEEQGAPAGAPPAPPA